MSPFPVLHEKVYPLPVRSDLVAWCPTMDLLATVTDAGEITISRLDGQKVWAQTLAAPDGQSRDVAKLSWRPDGQLLAVCSRQGRVTYLDVIDGRTVRVVRCPADLSNEDAAVLSWQRMVPPRLKADRIIHDVRLDLPLLSPLQAGSNPGDNLYATKAAIQAIFEPPVRQRDAIDLVSVTGTGGTMQTALGSFQLDFSFSLPDDYTVLYQQSSDDLGSHLAVAVSESGELGLTLAGLDLLAHHKALPHRILQLSQEFTTLSDYLHESLTALRDEYQIIQNNRDQLLKRCLYIICGAESGPELQCELMYLLLMGRLGPSKAFPHDINLGSLPKWRKSIEASLRSICRLAFDSLKPAVDRVLIMLQELIDLSGQGQDLSSGPIEVSIELFQAFAGGLSDVVVATHDELREFPIFCDWLLYACQRNHPDDEHAQQPQPVSTKPVLAYIRSSIAACRLDTFFADELQGHPGASPAHSKRLLTLLRAASQSDLDIFRPARALAKSSWHLRWPFRTLTRGHDWLCDLRVSGPASFDAAAVSRDDERPHSLTCLRICSNTGAVRAATGRIVVDGTAVSIRDVKIVDEQEILCLVAKPSAAGYWLVTLSMSELQFVDLPIGEVLHMQDEEITDLPVSRFRRLDEGIQPISIAVNGRAGRRVCVLLNSDRQRMSVLDLDDDDSGGSAGDVSEVESHGEMDTD